MEPLGSFRKTREPSAVETFFILSKILIAPGRDTEARK